MVQARIGWLASFIGLAGAIVLVTVPLTEAHTQGSAEIKERATELRAFRELLRSDDSLERMAAFEAGMASDDPIVQKITLGEGFAADDQNLRSLALKMWLQTRSNLIAEVELPDRPTDAQEKLYETIAPSLHITRIEIGESGELSGSIANRRSRGQFVPGGLILKVANCDLRLSVADANSLSGSYGCGPEGHLPVTVRIE